MKNRFALWSYHTVEILNILEGKCEIFIKSCKNFHAGRPAAERISGAGRALENFMNNSQNRG